MSAAKGGNAGLCVAEGQQDEKWRVQELVRVAELVSLWNGNTLPADHAEALQSFELNAENDLHADESGGKKLLHVKKIQNVKSKYD